MNPDRPLLTIAIPTYNRAKYLSELLESMQVQVAEHSDVEVIISDNASPDSTAEVLETFLRRGMKFTSLRNDENVGPDRNFMSLLNAASGKYLWLLGDDERLLPYTLEKVMPLLRSGDHDMVYLNAYGYTEDNVDVVVPMTKAGLRIFTDPVLFTEAVGSQFLFMSANIINIERLMGEASIDCQEGVGSFAIQLYWIYPMLNLMRSAVYVDEFWLITRSYKSTGWGWFQVVGINIIEIARKLVKSAEVVRALELAVLCKSMPANLMRMRGTGYLLNSESPREVLEPYWGRHPIYWIYVFPLIVLPNGLAKVWWFFIRASNKVRTVFVAKWRMLANG